jgi:hypothetical protein
MSGGAWGTVDDEESLYAWFYVALVILSIGFDLTVHKINDKLIRLADRRDQLEREEETSLMRQAATRSNALSSTLSESAGSHEDSSPKRARRPKGVTSVVGRKALQYVYGVGGHEEAHELEEAVEQRNSFDLAIAVWHRFTEEMMVLGFLAFILWGATQAGLFDLVAWRLNPALWEGDSPDSGSSGSSGGHGRLLGGSNSSGSNSSGSDSGSGGSSDGSSDGSSGGGAHYLPTDDVHCPRRVPTAGSTLLHAAVHAQRCAPRPRTRRSHAPPACRSQEHAHICLFVAMTSYFICLQAPTHPQQPA